MPVRGIRGATVVEQDQAEIVLAATRELLQAICAANPQLQPDDLASAIFTVTGDLNSIYPAQAARDLGWVHVPLLSAREIDVPGGMPRCSRVLLNWNTDLSQIDVQHVYLGAAASLRPDLSANQEG